MSKLKKLAWFAFGLLMVVLVQAAAVAADQKPVPPPVDLLAGAKWQYSTDDGKSWSDKPPVVAVGEKKTILGRIIFTAKTPSTCTCLELAGLNVGKFLPAHRLNDNPLAGPLEGMLYRTIPAIPVKLLKEGPNALTARLLVHVKKPKRGEGKPVTVRFQPKLLALTPEHLKFDIEPVLGAAGPDFFTLTCRTNMPARVTVGTCRTAGRQVAMFSISKTSNGLIHRFRVRVNGRGSHEYQIGATCGGTGHSTASGRVILPPTSGKLRFVATGDSRTHPKDWAKVAAAVLKEKPALVVFVGDMVTAGRRDWLWVEEFCGPAAKLFATIPFYAVIGNHEQQAPLYYELFYTPTGAKTEDCRDVNWSQQIGDVLLIGIDGAAKFSPGSENYKWLEGLLAASKAKFIFLFNHYPAWSSSGHGRLKKDGTPAERTSQVAQKHIVPLLIKYKATAYINGHCHSYERSEHPSGLTLMTSGGAGAPLRSKAKAAALQNPYSKVFASRHHYCLFEVSGDTCTMKVVTPAGEILDTRRWQARK